MFNHILNLPHKRAEDPSAWAKKYFVAASIPCVFFDWRRIGINLSKFSSRDTQIIIQFVLEIAIKDLRIKTEKDKSIVGFNDIRI